MVRQNRYSKNRERSGLQRKRYIHSWGGVTDRILRKQRNIRYTEKQIYSPLYRGTDIQRTDKDQLYIHRNTYILPCMRIENIYS